MEKLPYCIKIHIFIPISVLKGPQRFNTLNLLKPTGYVMYQQFNIQQLYVLPTLYLCVLYLSENKKQLVPLTASTDWFLTLKGPCIIFCNIYAFQRDTQCCSTDCLLMLRCQHYMFRTVTVRNMSS